MISIQGEVPLYTGTNTDLLQLPLPPIEPTGLLRALGYTDKLIEVVYIDWLL